MASRRSDLNEADVQVLVERDYPRLVNALALAWGDFGLAEEAVQEGVARLWERSESGFRAENPAAWVLSVASNLLRDRFRRALIERRARRRLAAVGEVSGALEGAEQRVDLGRALADLPRRQREAVVYRYYLDLDLVEVAALLGVPEGTAKSTLHRARRTLAGRLGQGEEVGDVRR